MSYRFLDNGVWRDLTSGIYMTPDAQYPVGSLKFYTKAQREAIGVFDIPEEPVVPPTLAERKAERLDELQMRRQQAEEGGITVQGIPVGTDAVSALKLLGASVKARENPSYVVRNWRAGRGQFVQLTAASIISISDAVEEHVQACFDREAQLSAQIMAAGNIFLVDNINIDTGWPS